jgi:hypothetical protein
MNCFWYLVYIASDNVISHLQGIPMSKTLSLGVAPSPSLFSRFVALLDHVLMTNAHIAHRNGDLPYFGL